MRHGDVARFDQRARTYDRTPGQYWFRRIDRPVGDALLGRSEVPEAVADVGCGTGRLLAALRERLPGAELIGVDPSEGMISVARGRFERGPGVRLHVASADGLPLGDASVDAVTTTLSFHHWDRQGPSLAEVARVLRPGGRLVLADILGIGAVGRLIRPLGRLHGSGYRSAAELGRLLEEAGFRAWRYRPIFGRLIPVFLVEARVTGS